VLLILASSGQLTPFLFVSIILIVLLAMSVHEYAHARIAYWWGDTTAYDMGKMTLDPRANINWIGFLMFFVIGFGPLGSVPVNPRRMRDPRWGSFWATFAGPLSNLGLAIAFMIVLRLLTGAIQSNVINAYDETSISMLTQVFSALYWGVYFNVLLFVFNLIPLYPLDGWRMMLSILPGYWLSREQVPDIIRKNVHPLSLFLQQPAFQWEKWAQITYFILMISIMIGFAVPQLSPLGWLISEPVIRITMALAGL
jgi:Zn-dependent protease